MKTKTFTVPTRNQRFYLAMVSGEVVTKNISGDYQVIGVRQSSQDPELILHSPEEVLTSRIERGLVIDGLNYAQVEMFTPARPETQVLEQVTYACHWLWGWREQSTQEDAS